MTSCAAAWCRCWRGGTCFRSLTVEENLVTGGIGARLFRAEIIRRSRAHLRTVSPPAREAAGYSPGLTSGGEQQMTAIGRALMARPRLLVLDEPSMGLAPLVVQDIFRALMRLNREEGLSILVAEQNSAVALSHAHRAVGARERCHRPLRHRGRTAAARRYQVVLSRRGGAARRVA